MRTTAGAALLVVGVLAAAYGIAVLVLLTRSPDSDWVNGATYSAPFLLGAALVLLMGLRLLRRPR